jgi:transcriptional regulator with XRE-family HTH domain
MKYSHLASYTRSHRKKAGLSQTELAKILDIDVAQISRHERAGVIPPLIAALGYEAVFGASVRELYPRLYDVAKRGVEEHLAAMEYELQQIDIKGRGSNAIARKLEWINERRSRTGTGLA